MSVSLALHDFVGVLLKGSAKVTSIVGQAIYDGVPKTAPKKYISFGPSDSIRADADCIPGRVETLQIDCWVEDQGKLWPCKRLVDAVIDAVHEKEGNLSVGALVSLGVTLTQTFIDRDGITAHGVVQVTAELEDPRP
ncbi:DUF3168 domain-containing protein [Pararhizobium gei]|uniref:DUF3168 domain-containing protein n=1 Tax=Pararhizobium gei TaxID=1395951 RepID=UPI0023DBA944|nr:DUF3168 domain-containing protein [Rhizobium gei]